LCLELIRYLFVLWTVSAAAATMIDWAPDESELLLFAGANLRKQVEALILGQGLPIPKSERRFLIRGRKI